MAYETREMSGSLFPNNKPDKGPNSPVYTGKAMIHGQLLYISAWVKEKNGKKWMSLAFNEPQSKFDQRAPQGSDFDAPTNVAQPDEDLPF